MVVTPVSEAAYHVRVLSKSDVPAFEPAVPPEGVLMAVNDSFREAFTALRMVILSVFLILSLNHFPLVVAAERACYHAPVFSSRMVRTRVTIIQDIATRYIASEKTRKK